MLPFEIRHQHDNLGNAPHLLSPEDAVRLENGDFYRASHLCTCNACGKEYGTHPVVVGAIWLNRLCNGDLVKF